MTGPGEAGEAEPRSALPDLLLPTISRPKVAPSPASLLTRRLLRELNREAPQPASVMRTVGRKLANDLGPLTLKEQFDSFAQAGLGDLGMEISDGLRLTFRGEGLIEIRQGAVQTTCHLALGFLEGIAGAWLGGEGLGTETRCQSRGDDSCIFVVLVRPPRP
jgi:predicted hydrocarbon binding protein